MASAAAAKKWPRLFQSWACSHVEQAGGTPRGPGPWPGGSARASRGPASARPVGAARRRPAEAVARRPGGRPARLPRGSGSLRSSKTPPRSIAIATRRRPTLEHRGPDSMWISMPRRRGRPVSRVNPELRTRYACVNSPDQARGCEPTSRIVEIIGGYSSRLAVGIRGDFHSRRRPRHLGMEEGV